MGQMPSVRRSRHRARRPPRCARARARGGVPRRRRAGRAGPARRARRGGGRGHARRGSDELDALGEVLGARHGFAGAGGRVRPSRQLDARHRARARPGIADRAVGGLRRDGAARRDRPRRRRPARALRRRAVHGAGAPPVLLDPFAGGARIALEAVTAEVRRCGRGARTRPRCGCSTTSSGPTRAATTSAARSARPRCGSSLRSSGGLAAALAAQLRGLRARLN